MKKQIANMISASRILAAAVLFFFSTITGAFLAIYFYCGFSDLIDGPVARKTGSVSVIGALLDTVGDILTYLALTKIMILQRLVPLWIIAWMLGTAVGFAASGFIALKRHGKFSLVHSLFGKILGGSVFVMPFAQKLNFGVLWMAVICTVSSIAAIESIVIQLKSDTLETDVTSIRQLLKEQKKQRAE